MINSEMQPKKYPLILNQPYTIGNELITILHDNEVNTYKQYLNEELQLVRYRMKMLDLIELKLLEMRELAQYAKDNHLSSQEIDTINKRLQELSTQIKCIDEESKLIAR